jgi:hypothetical protein
VRLPWKGDGDQGRLWERSNELLEARSGLHCQCLFAVEHEIAHFAFDKDNDLRGAIEASLREAILNVYAPMTAFIPVLGRKANQGWNF